MGNSFNKNKTGAMLRQSQARINIHRGKKLSSIAKKKDDICKHLDAGNEMNAKIWCETLINEEGLIPVYDVVSTMCDQINGRLTQIEKFGAPKDMNTTFATIIHAAPKLDVDELLKVRKDLSSILPKEFVRECDTNYDLINPVVADNIDFKKPEDGEIILRMVNLAKERNIDYTPTHESCVACLDYCTRKRIPHPPGLGGADGPVPEYVPQPAPMDIPPSMNGGPAPQGMPPLQPPGAMVNLDVPPGSQNLDVPPNSNVMGGMPAYNPAQQQTMQPQMQQMPAYQPSMAPPQGQPGFMPQGTPMMPAPQEQPGFQPMPDQQQPNVNQEAEEEDLQARISRLRGGD